MSKQWKNASYRQPEVSVKKGKYEGETQRKNVESLLVAAQQESLLGTAIGLLGGKGLLASRSCIDAWLWLRLATSPRTGFEERDIQHGD